jgi:hypothetical protein
VDPQRAANKLGKVWTHTTGVVAFVAAIATIVAFFGIRPTSDAKKPDPGKAISTPPKQAPDSSGTATAKQSGTARTIHTNGIGTLHLDGGFDPGRPMLTKAALTASVEPEALVLTNPANGKEEAITDLILTGPVEANQLVHVWRKGSRFLNGIHLVGEHPHVRAGGQGFDNIDIPTDSSGRLLVNVAWPAAKMFLQIEYPGPVQVGDLTLPGGILVGDAGTGESGNTLPIRFSIEFPKPGEVLDSFKAELTYRGRSDHGRYIVIDEDSNQDQAGATWSAEADPSGRTKIQMSKAGEYSQGLHSLRILYSTSSP